MTPTPVHWCETEVRILFPAALAQRHKGTTSYTHTHTHTHTHTTHTQTTWQGWRSSIPKLLVHSSSISIHTSWTHNVDSASAQLLLTLHHTHVGQGLLSRSQSEERVDSAYAKLTAAETLHRFAHNQILSTTSQIQVIQTLCESKIINTGVPQGCLSSPIYFTSYTNNCTSSHASTLNIKFSDDH